MQKSIPTENQDINHYPASSGVHTTEPTLIVETPDEEKRRQKLLADMEVQRQEIERYQIEQHRRQVAEQRQKRLAAQGWLRY